MSIKSTRTAALWYASQNWAIIPVWYLEDGLCACGDPNCDSPGKHPVTYIGRRAVCPGGKNDATTDKAVINGWWDINPRWNIATSSWFRIDVDTKKGGMERWQDVLFKNGPYGQTPVCKTPSGGQHIYFKPGPDYGNTNTEGDLPADINVRGHNAGYTLLPPSNHTMGVYTWLTHPKEVGIADAPSWLIALVGKDSTAKTDIAFSETDTPDVEGLPVSGLVKAIIAGDRSRIDSAVVTSLCAAGLTDDQIRAIFLSSPPSTKYAEKNGQGDAYLAITISNSRAWLARKRISYEAIEDRV